MNTHASEEMLTLAALDLLDEAESLALAQHLATCEECRTELESLRDTAAMLAYDAAPVAPSPELRDKLLSRIREEGSRRPAMTNVVQMPPAKSDADAASVNTESKFTRALLAIAAALLIACIIALILFGTRLNQTQAELAQQRSDLRRLQDERAREQIELARERETTDLLLRSPDARVATLAGTPQAPRARGRIVHDERTGESVFVSFNLPPAPAGKAYQLWFIRDGKPQPGGVFTTNANGYAVLREGASPTNVRPEAFAVTLEDASGSPTPRGDKYLIGAAS